MSAPTDPTGPREASPAWKNALRTGGAAAILTPLAHYRVTPLVVAGIGAPADSPEAAALLSTLDPIVAGGLLGGLAWAGTALRNWAHANQGGPVRRFLAAVLP